MAACTKVAAFGAILRLFYVGVGRQPLGLAAGAVGRRDPDHGRRVGARHHPDRHQAPAGLLLDRPRRVHPHRRAGLRPGRRLRGAVLPGRPTASRPSPRSPSSPSSATVGPRRRTCRSGRAWASATRSSPASFAFLLLAFAGIPLTSGFTAKYAVFAAAVAHGGAWLVVVGVLASAIAAFVYVRVIVLMYFSPPAGETTARRGALGGHDPGAGPRHGRHAGARHPALAPARPGVVTRRCSCDDLGAGNPVPADGLARAGRPAARRPRLRSTR